MIRVAVIDDHAIVRLGVSSLLADAVDLRVVGVFASAQEFLASAQLQDTDVALLDLVMPGCNGLDALPRLREAAPQVRILVFSGLAEDLYAPVVLRMGASGFLAKDRPPESIVQAVRTVHLGGFVASPAARAAPAGTRPGSQPQAHRQLSRREYEVFVQLARGHRLTKAAELLGISVKTASTYRARVLYKMQLQSNTELTRYAMANGLIL